MTTTTATDWTERGIEWERIPVSKRYGDNASDTREIGHVWCPRVIPTAIDKLVAHFGPVRVANWINGSGTLEVRARSWFKQRYVKNRDLVRMSEEDMKQAVYQNVLLSSGRSRIVEREIRIVVGSFVRIVKAGDEVTYESLFADALAANIDSMPDAPVPFLRQFVANSLATAGFEPEAEDTTE